MIVERLNYRGWANCYRLSNGIVDLIVTTDVGPRILYCALHDNDNLFFQVDDDIGRNPDDQYRFYGGHRLWHAPEDPQRTYFPDNQTVHYDIRSTPNPVFSLVQPAEPTTGVQKEINIQLQKNQVSVNHLLHNHNLWPIELSAWALTMMASEGTGILPLPTRESQDENLSPTSSLALWAYTDLSDSRWILGRHYILLRQDPRAQTPQKIGASVPDGWLAYVKHGQLFVKYFDYVAGYTYPDRDCNAEMFTTQRFLELESLSQVYRVEPGGFVEHHERWALHSGAPTPKNDADVTQHILPLIEEDLL